MILLWRGLFWRVLNRWVPWVVLWVNLRHNPWIRLRIDPWTGLGRIAIKCFYVAIGIHAWSESCPNIAPGFSTCLDLGIYILGSLRSVANHWILRKRAIFLELDQLGYLRVILVIIYNNCRLSHLNGLNLLYRLRIRLIFWTLFLQEHLKHFVHYLWSNDWCSIGFTVAFLNTLMLVRDLRCKSWSWHLGQMSASIVEWKLIFVLIDDCFEALVAVFVLLSLNFVLLLLLLYLYFNFNLAYLFLNLQYFLDRSHFLDTSEYRWELFLSWPVCCLHGWLSFAYRCLVKALESSKAAKDVLLSLCTVLGVRFAKGLGSDFTTVLIAGLGWGIVSFHIWLGCYSLIISVISSSRTELGLGMLNCLLVWAC